MNGLLVRSEEFRRHQVIGNPIHQVERFSAWAVDELIYLDITREGAHDLRRDDHKVKGSADLLEILEEISRSCFVPLTFGGGIRTLEDIRRAARARRRQGDDQHRARSRTRRSSPRPPARSAARRSSSRSTPCSGATAAGR